MSGEKNRPSFRPKRAIKSTLKGLPPKKLTLTKASSPPLAAAAKTEPKTENPPCVIEIGDKPTSSERSAKRRDGRACARGRLPLGSKYEFFQTLQLGNLIWKGILCVPSPDEGNTFTHMTTGLFQCAEELDLMYREWLKENEKEKKEKADEKPAGVQLSSLQDATSGNADSERQSGSD